MKQKHLSVSAKKHLGQHFLKDKNIARKIANTLTLSSYKNVLEIGPGMGVLTQFILEKDLHVSVMEIDTESVLYLETHFNSSLLQIIPADFLKYNLDLVFPNQPFAITGNFPYNISTQIVL